MPLPPGTRIGQYDVLGALGAGGMGEVYRARDTKLGRDVPLKILPDSVIHDPERLARFRREAQLLVALNHPHIGGIYGFGEDDGHQYLVLELIEGETLAARLQRGPIPVSEALEIAREIAAALRKTRCSRASVRADPRRSELGGGTEGQGEEVKFFRAHHPVPAWRAGPRVPAARRRDELVLARTTGVIYCRREADRTARRGPDA